MDESFQQCRRSGLNLLIALFFCFSSVVAFGQVDTIRVAMDMPPHEGHLNAAVRAAVDSGKLSSTMFVLQLNGRYVLANPILVPSGEHLTIIAPDPGARRETAPPQIPYTSGPAKYTAPSSLGETGRPLLSLNGKRGGVKACLPCFI